MANVADEVVAVGSSDSDCESSDWEEEYSEKTLSSGWDDSDEAPVLNDRRSEESSRLSKPQMDRGMRIQRPLTGYNCFQKWYMATAAREGRRGLKLCSPEVGGEISKQWAGLDNESKNRFEKEVVSLNGGFGNVRFKNYRSSSRRMQTRGNVASVVVYHSRCSPQQMMRLVREIGKRSHVSKVVVEMGFDKILRAQCGNMPKKFIALLMGHFDPFTCEFSERGQQEKITGGHVAELMGIPNGEVDVPTDEKAGEKVSKGFAALAERLLAKQMRCSGTRNSQACLVSSKFLVGKPNFKDLRAVLCSVGIEDCVLRQAFLLLVLGSVLCPTSSQTPSPKLHSAIVDVTDVKQYGWGDFVLSWLCEEIIALKKGKRKRHDIEGKRSVGGCLLVLMLFYFEMFPFTVFEVRPVNAHPLEFWTTKRIRQRVQLELEYASFNPTEGIGTNHKLKGIMVGNEVMNCGTCRRDQVSWDNCGISYYGGAKACAQKLIKSFESTKCCDVYLVQGDEEVVRLAEALMEKHIVAFSAELRSEIAKHAARSRNLNKPSAGKKVHAEMDNYGIRRVDGGNAPIVHTSESTVRGEPSQKKHDGSVG